MVVFFNLLCCFSFSSFSTYIKDRTFVYGTKKFNNRWEYGGYTIFDNSTNHFQLVPGDRFSEGFVWFSNRLPVSNWRIRSVFEFSLDSKFNQFGMWITSRFGPNGEVFGGPSSFVGIAVLFTLKSGLLEVECRQNDGNDDYRPISFFPEFSFHLKKPKIVILIATEKNDVLNISLIYNTNESHLLFKGNPNVSLSHNWFGVTASNSQDGLPLFLNSIKIFGLSPKFNATKAIVIDPKGTSNKFNLTQTDNLNYTDILFCIESLVNSSNKMLRPKLLSNVTRYKILPFSDSWQRRSLTITDQVKYLRKTVKNQLSEVEYQISYVSSKLQRTMMKFRGEIGIIENDLMTEIRSNGRINKAAKNAKKAIEENVLVIFLLYIGIMEVIFIIIFGVYTLFCKTKTRKFETE